MSPITRHLSPARRRVRGALALIFTLGVATAVVVAPGVASASPTTVTFGYTGGGQNWTVPAGVTSITVDMAGGQGGTGYGDPTPGSNGGRVEGSIAVTPGEVFGIVVAGAGDPGTDSGAVAGGYGGGGSGGGYPGEYGGGGGGGATQLWVGSSTPAVAAGGGGSGGGGSAAGGVGGGLDGSVAEGGGTLGGIALGGGGTQTSGGAGGTNDGSAGDAYNGGGAWSGYCTGVCSYGGGGGSGYYGGGAGGTYGASGGVGGGGGGGSSYLGSLSSATTTSGYEPGNGYVTISYTVVDTAPTITSSATTATFTMGHAGSLTFTATGTPTPSFSETGALPTGVTLSSAGVLAGTPSVAGVFGVTVTASNGVSPAATESFTLDVYGPPSITTTTSSATFSKGSAGSFTFTASGTPTPSFSETGALPTGVTLSSAGVLAGTPSESGVFGVTVTASNGVSPDATESFTIDVTGSPSFTSSGTAGFVQGVASSFAITTSADPTATLDYVGALPTGLSFAVNSSGGATISGTATGADGNYTLDLTASNSYGSTIQQLVISVGSGSAAHSPVTTTGGGPSTAVLDTGTLSFASSPANLTFPALSLDGSNQSTTADLALDIADATGSGAGWNVTITSTQFSSGSSTLPASATSVDAPPSASCDQNASCTPATPSGDVAYPVTVPAGSTAPVATRLYSAAAGSGMGDQTFSPAFILAVPANAAAGAYSSDWTLSLVSGP